MFAIAITLLILDIKVPRLHELSATTSLARALVRQWPAYLTYGTSFLTILVMWINYHRVLEHIRRVDSWLLLLNGLLLLLMAFIPFTTALMSEYLSDAHEGKTAAAVYSGTYLVFALVYNVLWRYAIHKGRLLGPHPDLAAIKAINRQYTAGPFLYAAVFGLAFINATLCFGASMLLAVFCAVPGKGRS